MRLSDISIPRKISLAFATIVIVLCAMSSFLFYGLSLVQDAAARQQISFDATSRVDDMAKAMLDLSGQVRGFLLTRDEDFAKGVSADYVNVKSDEDAVGNLLNDPGEKDALADMINAADGYMKEAGDPEITNARDPATLDKAVAIMKSGANKKWMNKFKAAQKGFQAIEAKIRDLLSHQRDSAIWNARLSLFFGGAATVVLAIALGSMLHRQVSAPVVAISHAMRRLAKGDNSVEVPNKERRDEVGAMAIAVDIFKQNAIERVQLEFETVTNRTKAEAERERVGAERVRSATEQTDAIGRLAEGLKRLAGGDLTFTLNDGFTETYAQIRDDFNDALARLKKTMISVVSSTRAIETGATQVSAAADDLSKRTEQQAAGLEETVAALHAITETVKKSAHGASHARQVVATADSNATQSAIVVRKAVSAMDAISNSSGKIGQIIAVIDEIAFQTNLLALNAGVEAARAGESGRGFAVVASEVRSLAQRSANAAKEIKGLIAESKAHVQEGVLLVAETGSSLERIISQVSEINMIVTQLATGAQEQATGLAQINSAIVQMDRTTQENASMVEKSTAASHSLSNESAQLANIITQFQVGDNGGMSLGSAKPTAYSRQPKLVASGGAASRRSKF